MTYASKDLSTLTYSNGFTLLLYKTADNLATVGTDGYFNTASDQLHKGDIIIVSTASPAAALFLVLSSTELSGIGVKYPRVDVTKLL